MFKNTKLYSILNNKCPKCHESDFFIEKNPYKLKTFDKMYDHCHNCGESFNKEIGFYYGAMYVSYGLNIGVGLALFLLMILLLKLSIIVYLVTFFIVVVITFPLMMRISRLIWVNLFVKFDGSKSKKLSK